MSAYHGNHLRHAGVLFLQASTSPRAYAEDAHDEAVRASRSAPERDERKEREKEEKW